MARIVAINGVEAKVRVGSLRINKVANGRGTMSGTVYGGDTPELGQRLGVIKDVAPGARVFNGTSSVLSRAFSSGTTDNWTIGIVAKMTATGSQRFMLNVGDTVDGSSSCAMGLYRVASISGYVLGPPETGAIHNLDIGRDLSGQRVRNVFGTNVYAHTSFRERGRTDALGDQIAVAHNAANFTGNGTITWTVASGDQALYEYALIGEYAWVRLALRLTSVSGTGSRLIVTLPFTIVGAVDRVGEVIQNGTEGKCYTDASSGTSLTFTLAGGANWAASTNATFVFWEGLIRIA